jgi:hypothetical protein
LRLTPKLAKPYTINTMDRINFFTAAKIATKMQCISAYFVELALNTI